MEIGREREKKNDDVRRRRIRCVKKIRTQSPASATLTVGCPNGEVDPVRASAAVETAG